MFLRELDRLPNEKPGDPNLPAMDLGILSNECMLLACARFERGDRRGGNRALKRAKEFATEWSRYMQIITSREDFVWGPRRINEQG